MKVSWFLSLICAYPALCEVKPAALFSDHMVLQSGMPVPVWGTASPGETVTVGIEEQKQTVAANAGGAWLVRLTDLKPGGPFEMTVSGKNAMVIHDVLVGEVWLGSGQSNMAFTVSKKKALYAGLVNEEQVIAAANYPKVRMFMAKTAKTYEPQRDLAGEWQVCRPETVPGFSAVAYLFGRNLQKELNVPVGMLVLAFGASTAESWIRDLISSVVMSSPFQMRRSTNP
jgi:sialate O-acetylesterase